MVGTSGNVSGSVGGLGAVMTLLAAGGALAQVDEALIEEGRRLFLEETFEGNGRTCATCHPPSLIRSSNGIVRLLWSMNRAWMK